MSFDHLNHHGKPTLVSFLLVNGDSIPYKAQLDITGVDHSTCAKDSLFVYVVQKSTLHWFQVI
jgi:hypothetical protein